MATNAFRVGGVATDDYSEIKILRLPSDAQDDDPITFHDSSGSDYQVPADHVFIAGLLLFQTSSSNAWPLRVGESGSADGAIATEVILITGEDSGVWYHEEVMGVFTAGNYVTAESSDTDDNFLAQSTLYGIEVSTS